MDTGQAKTIAKLTAVQVLCSHSLDSPWLLFLEFGLETFPPVCFLVCLAFRHRQDYFCSHFIKFGEKMNYTNNYFYSPHLN